MSFQLVFIYLFFSFSFFLWLMNYFAQALVPAYLLYLNII